MNRVIRYVILVLCSAFIIFVAKFMRIYWIQILSLQTYFNCYHSYTDVCMLVVSEIRTGRVEHYESHEVHVITTPACARGSRAKPNSLAASQVQLQHYVN